MSDVVLVPPSDFDYDVRGLFRATAEATVTAQKELDAGLAALYHRFGETAGHQILYTIPRTSVELRFGVVETSGGSWHLVPWKRTLKREQMHTHELRFTVDAVTQPPPQLKTDDGLPVVLSMKAPYFMLTPKEEKDVAKLVLAALDPAAHNWVSVIPGQVKDLEKKVLNEREDFEKSLGKDDSERGPVFFRFEGSPASFLVVRVVGKDANDSIFVVTPEATPEVVIHSIDGDEVKSVRYEPLHHLLHTIRRAQEGALAPIVTTDISPTGALGATQPGTGLRGLIPFAEDIRAGYEAGLEYLSDAVAESFSRFDNVQLTPSVFYDLAGVLATLTYSLGYKKQGDQQVPTFDFEIRRTSLDDPIKGDGDTDEVRLIESRARVRASRDAAGPRTEIEFDTPEFVLSGAARKRLLELALATEAGIKKAFGADGELYAGFLKNETFQGRVVALLSYRGSPPKEEFLVVWPGEYVGLSRDFAFTCGLDKNRAQLDDVKKVFGVDQDIGGVQLTSENGEAAASGEQYRPFHNFFHAVRIWRARSIT